MSFKIRILILGLALTFMPVSPAYSGPDSNTLILPKMNYKKFKQINRTFDDPLPITDSVDSVEVNYLHTRCSVRNPGQSDAISDDVLGCSSRYSIGWEDEEGTRQSGFISIKHNDWGG